MKTGGLAKVIHISLSEHISPEIIYRKTLKCYLFLLMWPRPHVIFYIYIPDVSLWSFKISAVFPTMLKLKDGGQGSFLCPSMILIILRAEEVQFSS